MSCWAVAVTVVIVSRKLEQTSYAVHGRTRAQKEKEEEGRGRGRGREEDGGRRNNERGMLTYPFF